MKRKRERERARERERERGEGRYFDLLRFGPGSVKGDVGGQVDFVQLVVHELPQVPRQVVVSKKKTDSEPFFIFRYVRMYKYTFMLLLVYPLFSIGMARISSHCEIPIF